MASVTERFWSKVDTSGDCWLWVASVNAVTGYGAFSTGNRKSVGAHRFAYEQVNGPIPEGLQIDHLCRVRACVNPAHLEAVTPRENTRRGIVGFVNSTRFSAITHCKHGHEFTEENTYRYDGMRHCRTCAVARTKAWRANKRIIGAK